MNVTIIKSYIRCRDGNVSVIGALTLPLLVGFVSLAADVGHGLVVKTENQRVADLASYAAGLAYSATGSTTTMASVAANVASLNGLASSSVTASLATSPRVAADQAVMVKIAANDILFLAPVMGYGRSLPVNADSYAQLATHAASACMIALSSSGSGIAMSGGTSISAPTCTVSSNNSVTVPCGDTITAKSLTYNGAAPTQGCSGITAAVSKASTSDPLASNEGVLALEAHEPAVNALSAPSAPSVSTASDNSFQYSSSATLPSGCTGTYANGTWNLTCSISGATYHFGNFTVGGGVTVNVTTTSTATYDFSGTISNSGASLTFGAGTYNIAKGIVGGGGSVTTFGAGTFNLGPAASCTSSYSYSICNKGTSMTFEGPSTFVMSAGVYNGGGSKLTLGSGTSNSFQVGSGSDGNAVNLGGGATTVFADATGTGDVFQLVGNFYQSGGGCTTVSAATQHDIHGNLNSAGGISLGAGVYTVSGYIGIGASGGGDVSCNGTEIGVSGVSVTLVTEGEQTISGGSCNEMTFCVGAGFSHVVLSAPSSGTYAYLAVVGPTSSSYTGGATFTAGASDTDFAGAVYFPNGPMTLTGGASIGNISGQCLQIIATYISLSGGTAATASSCFAGTSSSSSVELVQ